jgi:ABC-type ATPase involved in cell division
MSKRRRAERTRVRLGGSIAVQDAKVLLDQHAIVGEVAQEMQLDGGSTREARTRVRRSGVCVKLEHNARTC